MLYDHIVTGGRPRSHVVRPYRNWWTSTDVMLYVHRDSDYVHCVMLHVHIVTGGRPWPHVVRSYRNRWTSTDVMLYVHRETDGRPLM